jgi:2-oxoglutarate ferredoxin oxidoreductase subunit alpha
VLEGDHDAPIGLIIWGSVAGVALEAVRQAREEGLEVKLLMPKLLFPVAEEIYQDFFASVTRGLVVEQSHQGQLYRVIRMYVNVPSGVESLTRSGSNPIVPGEVLDRVRQMALAVQRKRKYEPEPPLG